MPVRMEMTFRMNIGFCLSEPVEKKKKEIPRGIRKEVPIVHIKSIVNAGTIVAALWEMNREGDGGDGRSIYRR